MMKPTKDLITVENIDDIPEFASEAEEHAFWATHEFSEALLAQAQPFEADELPPPRKAPIETTHGRRGRAGTPPRRSS